MSTIISLSGSAGSNSIINTPTIADAFGRLRVSEPLTLFDSSHRYSDNGLWATKINSGGAKTFDANQGTILLTVDGIAGSSVIRETFKVFSYQPGKSLFVMNTFVMSPAKVGLTQRVGYFGDDNGFYLELENNTLSFVRRSSVTGSVVETAVDQANWNYDKMDGTGPSGITLDLTKAQILWMDMEWLGVGSVRMGFVINGTFYICHIFQHANIITSTYITTASLPLRYEIENTSNTGSASTLKQICSSVISEGGYELRGAQYSIGIPINAPITYTSANVYVPIVGIKLTNTKLDAVVILTAISVLGIGNGKNYQWRIVQGGSISGGAYVSAGLASAVEYNITGTSVTGGNVIASGYLNSSNQASPVVNILKGALFSSQLERNGLTGTALELILEIAIGDASGTNGIFASVDWEEISR